jgi:hypothetical protein
LVAIAGDWWAGQGSGGAADEAVIEAKVGGVIEVASVDDLLVG